MDRKKLIKSARVQGWEVTRTRRGHLKFRSPDPGVPLIFGSGTPSDYRSPRNLAAHLRRAGLTV
jgi:predicted RNA binding protein YcfA (HicA-like mRNA interferase family)